MIPALAASRMLALFATPKDFEKDPEGRGIKHVKFMLNEIASERVKHEKAHRWLGYAQGMLVSSESFTLDQCKQINVEA